MAEEIHNTYRVSVDRNQSGKYEVRIQARYTERRWTLGVYFQASSPERVFNRLAAALRFLQRREEELWLWGSNPSDRGLLFEELLAEAGLAIDRRREFPRGGVVLSVRVGESFRPLHLAELKRKLEARLTAVGRAGRCPVEALRSSA